MKLACQCCGFEREFEDGEEAFQAGWDAPPYFTVYVGCDLCPMTCLLGERSHAKAHALWAKEGRPKTFTVAKCADDERFGGPELTEQEMDEVKAFAARALGKLQ